MKRTDVDEEERMSTEWMQQENRQITRIEPFSLNNTVSS